MKIINASKKEIESHFENEEKRKALSQLVGAAPTVKDNIAMFNKKLARAEQDKLMKKVSASLLALQAETPTPLELAYQQKVHSAAQFENVPYEIKDILEFVTSSQKEEKSLTTETVESLSDHIQSAGSILLSLQDGDEYLVVDNQEKYKINIFLVQNKDNDKIYQMII